MECPKCSAKADEGTLFCPQCGARFQLDPSEGHVMSMEEWKLKKFREKNEARKEKAQVNRPKYENIHERMLNVQADSDLEVIEKALEAKKNEKKRTELKKNRAETEPVNNASANSETDEKNTGGKYNDLFDFEGSIGDMKAGKDELKNELKAELEQEDEEEASFENTPKRRRRRKAASLDED